LGETQLLNYHETALALDLNTQRKHWCDAVAQLTIKWPSIDIWSCNLIKSVYNHITTDWQVHYNALNSHANNSIKLNATIYKMAWLVASLAI
jgi:ribosomal protein L37AE/L43A